MNNPKYRRPLNSDQIETLELLYKFRFGSVDLVREYFDKSSRGLIFNRLKVLEDQDLIAKHFDSSYRIQGKPAAYYLLPAGARKIQERRDPEDDQVNIKGIYKDKSVSESFIEHALNIFGTYSQLKSQYGNMLSFFTKSDLVSYEHFPKPLPDAFLNLEKAETTKHFFLDILEEDQPFFTSVRKIKKYMDYKDSGNWISTGEDFPAILLICESTSFQKRLRKQIARMLDKSLAYNLIFVTTTKEELKALKDSDVIWQSTFEFDEKLSLQDIL